MTLRPGVSVAFAATLFAAANGWAQSTVPNGTREAPQAGHELQLLIRSARANTDMRTTVFLPSGRGPFPLAVINHGSTESAELRETHERPTFDVLSTWLVRRGFVVALPQRPGHGETGGPYIETAGGCEDADYDKAGVATADSIATVINHMMAQPYVRRGRVLLAGHSAGAWGALALASQNPDLVGGIISFAAGRGGRSYGLPNRNCAPEQLVSTAARFGQKVRVPTLWIYSVNDKFFDSFLSRRMAEAFRAGGAPTEYRLLQAVGDDGHYLVFSADAVPYWEPTVQRFLAGLK